MMHFHSEQEEDPRTGQEIVIYANHKQTVWRVLLLDVLSLFVCLMVVLSSVALVALGVQSSSGIGDILTVLAICALPFLLLYAIAALLAVVSWNMSAQFLFSRKPYLIVNAEGITVGRQALLRHFFIPWSEIESLAHGYTGRGGYRCLNIAPRDDRRFFSRFSFIERSNLRPGEGKGKVIAVPQVYLQETVDELLTQVRQQFARELRDYHVQVEGGVLPQQRSTKNRWNDISRHRA